MTNPARESRWRQVGVGATVLIVGRVTAAACGLIQVPIILTHLGAERFGVWAAITGLMWTLGGFDGGLGFALQNRITRLLAVGEESAAATLVRRGQRYFWTATLGLAVLGIPVFLWGDWARWLHVTDGSLTTETRQSVLIIYVAVIAALPGSFPTRVAAAAGATWLVGLWTAIASLIALAATIVCRAQGYGLPAFVATSAILLLLPYVATAIHLRWRCRWLAEPNVPASMPDSGLWRESLLFFIPQLGAAVTNSFVPTLVAFFAGPVTAGGYGILQRFFGLGLQLQTLSLQPTWPAYAQAAAQSDGAGARRLYRVSILGTLALGLALTVLLVPFVRPILDLWLGHDRPTVSALLIWMVAIWHLVQAVAQPPSMLLNGTGRNSVIAGCTAICIGSTLALCPWLGPRWGAVGVVTALVAPYALFNLPVLLTQAQSALGKIPTRA